MALTRSARRKEARVRRAIIFLVVSVRRPGELCVSVPLNDVPPDAVFEKRNIEVNEQPKMATTEANIRQNYGLVNRRKRVDGFQLHHDFRFHKQIDSVSTLELHVFVHQRDGLLPFYSQFAQRELTPEAFLVG